MADVEVERHGAVALLRLNRPAQRNTLSIAVSRDLQVAVRELQADPQMHCLVITGAPPAFCAGGDLDELVAAGEGSGTELQAIYAGFMAVADCTLPCIAAVNGAAVGAGMNLALACDVRLASPSARFDTRFMALGIHPGGGHSWLLHREFGRQTSNALLLFGEVLDGENAARVGLAWRCVPEAALLESAFALARRCADVDRHLLMQTKATLRATAQLPTHAEALDLEFAAQLSSLKSTSGAARLRGMQRRLREGTRPPDR